MCYGIQPLYLQGFSADLERYVLNIIFITQSRLLSCSASARPFKPRERKNNFSFIYNLLFGKIDPPTFLSFISIKVKHRTTHHLAGSTISNSLNSLTRYQKNFPITRLIQIKNNGSSFSFCNHV